MLSLRFSANVFYLIKINQCSLLLEAVHLSDALILFKAFDADNGGSIDLNEIREIVIWMFRFAGIEEDPDLLASCVIDVR